MLCLCKEMCCCAWCDCLLQTDSNPVFSRGRLMAWKPLKVISCPMRNFFFTHPLVQFSTKKKGRILEPVLFPRLFTNPSQLCSFANCTHVLQSLSHGPSHAQATRPDGGQAGVGQQLPRNPGNILLRPPVSALG